MGVPDALRSIDSIMDGLTAHRYIADRAMATTLFLAARLKKPVLLEGEAGTGKTEVAKVLAEMLDTDLIRLQCYEGLDAAQALYEWNYVRQILRIRMAEGTEQKTQELERQLFSEEFLIRRPLLEAILHDGPLPPVLLIDEVDRADEEFEAFLLETLSDFQITIPELGTLRAKRIPYVLLTSNRTRDLHVALKRRCLYLWIPHPDFEKECRIVRARVPGIGERLTAELCRFVGEIRRMDLFKNPGVAETLDWAAALMALNVTGLTVDVVRDTLGCILKYHEDLERVPPGTIARLVDMARGEGPGRAGGTVAPRSSGSPRRPLPAADGEGWSR